MTSAAFEAYDERLQRWIWKRGWTGLRDIQELAADPILSADRDVIIASATASGKTEAALLPALTFIAAHPAPGLRLLIVSPLKALINDQHDRLEHLCEPLDIAVHRWHGDVPASRKRKVREGAGGVLLITPESLEALFIRRGSQVPQLLDNLAFVLVDELHAFIGSERGKQLQSLLHRMELAVRRRLPRIALSATLGDLAMASEFLRPGHGEGVEVITSDANRHSVALQVRGYRHSDPRMQPEPDAADAEDAADAKKDAVDTENGSETQRQAAADDPDLDIANDLWRLLRGGRHIAFCNTRAGVESLSDRLRRRAERERLPSEFWPHHGNLSKDLRESAEDELRQGRRPATVVATATLELGIDVGTVETIAQVAPPSSVAVMRQRLGRSGRAEDAASTLRIFVSEPEITSMTPPHDTLRPSLIQAIAMVRLLIRGFNEPPDPQALHLSTLVQQTLSLIAQHGSVTAADAWRALCQSGPFNGVDPTCFATLLRSLGAHDLISQMHDGHLVLGLAGERLVNHFSFYAAFATTDEYRLVSGAKTLGSLPVDSPLMPGMHLIFAGRRWVVVTVETERKVVDVAPSPGGSLPPFGGNGPWVHDRIRKEMRAVYRDTDAPRYLDPTATELLAEARTWFERHQLNRRPAISWGNGTLLFPWVGDRKLHTLMLQLATTGVKAAVERVAIYVEAPADETRALLEGLRDRGTADPLEIAGGIENLETAKHHPWLDHDLLVADYASARIDAVGAHATATALVEALG